jgi:tRNA nucleotidyltransferase/poly(A) polymerase
MPDYIYLLENRLSADQRNAISHLRTAARDAGFILFLTGDAVRDLTSGHAVRELEVAVHGNALKLKKPIEKLGGKVWGEDELSKTLYLCFPGTVRVDVVSTHRVEYAKPGKPVYHPASIHEDLRRRDFTVNSMAISLNDGSFGLLMDPLNGAADIEARILRLVSNYGFIEDPSLMIRAARYRARLGWEMDARTQARYDNSKSEGSIEFLSAHARSQELEQIGHEEDGLKVLRALEAEGWMKVLFPAWTEAKADQAKLTALHDLAVELLVQGIHPDVSAAQTQLLTLKMQPKDLSALKKSMLRPGFVEEWNQLDHDASGFAKVLVSKQNAKPSASYKLFMSYDPEAILWLGFTSKDKAVQERFNLFLKVWPEARQRIPHALMQEMRITPELPKYNELIQNLFLEFIDGRLSTPEELRAYLEPYSPPAPPPRETIKRPRVRRAEARMKEKAFEEEDEDEDEGLAADGEIEPVGADDEELDLVIPKGDLEMEADEEEETDEGDDAEDEEAAAAPAGKKRPPEPAKKGKQSAAAKAIGAVSAGKASDVKSKTATAAAPSSAKAQVAPAKASVAAKIPAAAVKAPSAAAKVTPAPGKIQPAAAGKTAAPAAKMQKPAKLQAKAKSSPRPLAKAATPRLKKPLARVSAKTAKPAKRSVPKPAKPPAKKPAKPAKKR